MEKFWNGFGDFLKKSFSGLQFISIIVWLLSWYVVTTWLVLGTLSSHQFQQRLTNVVDKETKRNYSVPALLRLSNQYEKNQIQIKEIKTRIYELLKKLETSDRKLTVLKVERTTYVANFSDLSKNLKLEFADVKTQYSNLLTQMSPAKDSKETKDAPPVNTNTNPN